MKVQPYWHAPNITQIVIQSFPITYKACKANSSAFKVSKCIVSAWMCMKCSSLMSKIKKTTADSEVFPFWMCAAIWGQQQDFFWSDFGAGDGKIILSLSSFPKFNLLSRSII